MAQATRRRASAFARDASGVSAIEFALIAPILLLLMMASVEFQRYLRTSRQLANAADQIATLVAQRSETLPNWDALSEDFDSAYQSFPEAPLRADVGTWRTVLRHRIAQASFSKVSPACTTNCAYNAKMSWMWGSGAAPTGMARQCGALTLAPDGAEPSGDSIPERLVGPGSVIIVDLFFDYYPVFGSTLVQPVTMAKTGYAFPRFVSSFTPTGGATGQAVVCP
jgi:Flp pilus assembly pilin Flp